MSCDFLFRVSEKHWFCNRALLTRCYGCKGKTVQLQSFPETVYFELVMATLLHFLRSLVATLLAGFVLALSGLGMLVSSLGMLRRSPVGFVSDPLYVQVSKFLTAFGGGSRTEGMIAIALTLSVALSLLFGFAFCKRSQRSTWQLAMTEDSAVRY